jgi:curved DNA-binding protein CbpA
MDAENYYEILGIGPDADDDEVKQAFRELAKNYHPDRNPGDEAAERRFKLVGTAYDALKDTSRRQTYNEWLAFNVGQQKSHRRQWGRLAAVLALLMLGPSAVLYGIVAFGGTNVFDQLIGNVSVAAPEPGATETKTAAAVEAAGKQDEDEVEQQAAALDQAPPNTPDAADASGSAGISAPGAAAEEDDARPASAEADASDAAVAAVSSDEAQTAHQPAGATTKTIPAVQPDPEPPAARDDPPGNRSPKAGATGENDVIASARMLAELKEPDGAAATPERQTPRPPERRTAAIAAPQSMPDTFSDCEFCPVMSLTRRPKTVLAENDLAVSLSEITVAQWNVCVEDGGCPPYRSERDDPAAPVTGLSAGNAGAYAEWLSAHTGERYRIVAPLAIPERGAASGAATPRNCDPISKRRKLTGWDWLDEGPRRENCPPESSPRAAGNDAGGFRVARPVRHEG